MDATGMAIGDDPDQPDPPDTPTAATKFGEATPRNLINDITSYGLAAVSVFATMVGLYVAVVGTADQDWVAVGIGAAIALGVAFPVGRRVRAWRADAIRLAATQQSLLLSNLRTSNVRGRLADTSARHEEAVRLAAEHARDQAMGAVLGWFTTPPALETKDVGPDHRIILFGPPGNPVQIGSVYEFVNRTGRCTALAMAIREEPIRPDRQAFVVVEELDSDYCEELRNHRTDPSIPDGAHLRRHIPSATEAAIGTELERQVLLMIGTTHDA